MAMQPQSGAQLHANTTPIGAYPPQPQLPGNSNNHPAPTAPPPAGFVPAAAPVVGGGQFVPVAAPGVAGGVQFVPVAAAAPPVPVRGHRRQGPSPLLSGLVAFRMGQRSAQRSMRRMGRR